MKTLTRITFLITALFTIFLYFKITYIEQKYISIDNEKELYKSLYLKCNSDRMEVNAILKGKKNKTLIYW